MKPGELHLLTGEYPPQRGGVADYTAVVAAALVAKGWQVHVWSPGEELTPTVEATGVTVHRVAGKFGLAGLIRLWRKLRPFTRSRVLIVQYVPHGYGWKAMNLPFALWVLARRLLAWDDVRVMFHEAVFPWVRRPLRHNLIAAVTRVMAWLLLRACTRAYVSVPAWEVSLRSIGAGSTPITWLPIPSSLPDDPSTDIVEGFRNAFTQGDRSAAVIGHFGTYGVLIAPLLLPILNAILDRQPTVRVALIGARSDRFREEWLRSRPELSPRITATGERPVRDLAAALRACDLAVQPYPDGASARRTTLTAALANAVPVVTNLGRLTDPLVAAAPLASAPLERMADRTLELLECSNRVELGSAGQRYYEEHFAVEHTVAGIVADLPRREVPR